MARAVTAVTAVHLLAALAPAASVTPPIVSSVWPQPQSASFGTTLLSVCDAATFSFSCNGACPAPLPAAFTRYSGLIFYAGASAASAVPPSSPQLCGVTVTIDADSPLALHVNESYTLRVPSDGTPAAIDAANQWGALRGLETLLQLVVWSPAAPAYTVTNAPVLIVDAPRFDVRGVLIDTSFNFLTVGRIKELLDSMPVTKSNVLHWHIVDDPAWPMESTTYPRFTSNGGPYAPVAMYSVANQADIAAYAWERGVMILYELDLPGHCASWGAGNSDLVVSCDGHQTLINPVGEPGDGRIYDVVDGLIREFSLRLGGFPLVHLGGDEVSDYHCWITSPEVQAWATKIGIDGQDPAALRTAFTRTIQGVVSNASLRSIFWEETFLGKFGVLENSIITPWVNPLTAGAATAAGHDVINYVGYYLDQWVPPARTDVDWYAANVSYGFIESWRLLYLYDPEQGVSPSSPGRVLGGVASAWGDNVDSSIGATGLLFPRALAVGEVLWSPASFTRAPAGDVESPALDAVRFRMERARCRLAQRGVNAAPVGIAGEYGFCWSPQWEDSGATPQQQSADVVSLSSGAFAAVLLAAALGGAGLVSLVSGVQSAGGIRVLVRSICARVYASPPADDAASLSKSMSAPRVIALDQFRGATMVGMLFVNLYYGRSGLPPFFSHGITYMSGPDLIEPAFHFCVGYALRLVVLKRLAGKGEGAAAARGDLFLQLLKTRVFGLILLSMFFSEGWGQFDSWSDIGGFSTWLLALVQNVQPYHTLLHIAFITVFTFVPMTLSWHWRAAQLVFSFALHCLIHFTFYFKWVKVYGLDEGGYFGFLGWSITALTGSIAHDIVVAASEPRSGGAPTDESFNAPLIEPRGAGAINDDSYYDAVDSEGNAQAVRTSRLSQAAGRLSVIGLGFMVIAYLFSCLGSVQSLNPVCYDGLRIYFWGGFGDEAPCRNVPVYGWGLVAPPFFVPDPTTNVVTMWTFTQRAGSATYHLFTAGTSITFFAFFVLVCEVGAPASWLRSATTRTVASYLGFRVGTDGRLRLRWHVADVFGENALAVYLLSDPLADHISDMLPDPCPNWYFLLWGEGLYFIVAFIATSYLRTHKLFLRL